LLRGHEGPVYRVAYAPDGKSLASASYDRTVRVWAAGLEELIRLAGRKAQRNLTWEEWQQFFPGEHYRRTFRQLPDGDGVAQALPQAGP
jgi:WD40 repeat protein